MTDANSRYVLILLGGLKLTLPGGVGGSSRVWSDHIRDSTKKLLKHPQMSLLTGLMIPFEHEVLTDV